MYFCCFQSASDERYAFLAEWYDPQAALMRKYQLLYYPSDSTVEMVRNPKTRLSFSCFANQKNRDKINLRIFEGCLKLEVVCWLVTVECLKKRATGDSVQLRKNGMHEK